MRWWKSEAGWAVSALPISSLARRLSQRARRLSNSVSRRLHPEIGKPGPCPAKHGALKTPPPKQSAGKHPKARLMTLGIHRILKFNLMFTKRTSFNSKRSICKTSSSADLKRWRHSVTYGGNPEHKRNPGDFGLTPAASPRRDKTLCDGVNIFQRAVALKLLREGVRRGLVSEQTRN